MKRAILVVACGLFAASALAGGPTFYVPVDIDLVGHADPECIPENGQQVDPCVNTVNNIIFLRGDTKSRLRIPQFWDGTGAVFEFAFWGYNHFYVDPGPDTAFRAVLRIMEQGSDPNVPIYSTQIDSSYTQANEMLLVSFNLTDLFDDGVLTAGGTYLLELNGRFLNWENSGYYWGNHTLVFPVVLPFVFENGFESGHAAFWSEVMDR